MKKRVLLLTFLLGLMLVRFVNAQLGYYGGFSLSNFFYSIDSVTMSLVLVFIISFAFLIFILQKSIFRENSTIAAVISFALSLGITYSLNRTGFNIAGLFYGFGISPDLLFTIFLMLFFILVIYFAVKKKLRYLILGLGLLLIILALFTDLIYERGVALLIGGALLLIGFWLISRNKKKKRRAHYDYGDYPPSRGGQGIWEKTKDWRDPGKRLERYKSKRELRRLKREDTFETGRRWGHFAGQVSSKLKRKQKKEQRKQETAQGRQEQQRREETRNQEKQKKILSLQEGSHLDYLKREYNRIQRKDPRDPKLEEIANQVKRIRKQR